jgi:gliding motility-associated-like protein
MVKSDSIKSYIWVDDSGDIITRDSIFSPVLSGTYDLYMVDFNNCNRKETISYIKFPNPEIILNNPPNRIKANSQDVSFLISNYSPFNIYSWEFSNQYGNLSVNEPINNEGIINFNSKAGNIKLTITSFSQETGCRDTLTQNIEVYYPPPLNLTSNITNETCPGTKDGSMNIDVSGSEDYTYIRVTDENGKALEGNYHEGNPASFSIDNISAGKYYVNAQNFWVDDIENELIEIGYQNRAQPEVQNTPLKCKGDISSISINHDSLNSIYWYNQAGILISDNNTFETQMPGYYKAVLSYSSFCPDTLGFNIPIPDSIEYEINIPQKPFCPDICDGELEIRQVSPTGNKAYLLYEGDTILNSFGEYVYDLCNGDYILMVENNKCNNDTFTLSVKHIDCSFIPNAITPNGDGVHDYWDLSSTLELFPDTKVEIFNRWGKLVFSSPNGYPKPFNGKSNGVPLPDGTYFYVISYEGSSGERTKTGYLTILY